MLKLVDSKNLGYMLEGSHGICAIFQAASAAAQCKSNNQIGRDGDGNHVLGY